MSQWLNERTGRAQSYAAVFDRYRTNAEPKSLGADGLPCGRRTVGLLGWRPIVLGKLVHIGKETNRMGRWSRGWCTTGATCS